MRRAAVIVALAFLFLPAGLRADEGRIPLYQPTIINQPGHYILTRNISVTAGTPLQITASNVEVDLNGLSVASTDLSAVLIEVGDGVDNVRIRNGRLSGGSVALKTGGPPSGGFHIYLDKLDIHATAGNYGIFILGAAHVELLSSSVVGSTGSSAVYIDGNGSAFWTGRIVGNRLGNSSDCLDLWRLSRGEVRSNIASGCTAVGITVGNTSTPDAGSAYGGNVIRDNLISGAGSTGILLQGDAPGNLVADNVVKGTGSGASTAMGIAVRSSDNRITGNVVMDTIGMAAGIQIEGAKNLLEGNLVESTNGFPGYGLYFVGAASTGNVYRNNMLRDNSTGAIGVIGGATCTDGGGNFL